MKQVKLTRKSFDKGVAAGGGYEYNIIENGIEYQYLGWAMNASCRLVTPEGQINRVGLFEEKILNESVPMAQIIEEIYSLPKFKDPNGQYMSIAYIDQNGQYWGKEVHLEHKVEKIESYKAFDSRHLVVVDVVKVNIESLYSNYQKEAEKAVEILQKKISKEVWMDSEKSSCYNHTHFIVIDGIKVVSLAYETYSSDTPRHWTNLEWTAQQIVDAVMKELNNPSSDYNKSLEAEAAEKAAEAKRVKELIKSAKEGGFYHKNAPLAAFELVLAWKKKGAEKLSKKLAKKANKHFAWSHVHNVLGKKMLKGGKYYHHEHCLYVYQWALDLYI